MYISDLPGAQIKEPDRTRNKTHEQLLLEEAIFDAQVAWRNSTNQSVHSDGAGAAIGALAAEIFRHRARLEK